MEWVLWLFLIIAAAGSLLLALLGLPGLWVMLILAIGYGWATAWASVGPWTIAALLLLALSAEVIESLASAAGAKRAGASKRAMLLSVVGAIVGGIAFTALIPIPVLGTIVGLCAGAFAGAVLGEVFKGRNRDQVFKSGLGAAAGRLAGTVIKLAIGSMMLLILAVVSLPLWVRPTAAPAALPSISPATAPATTPTTMPTTAPQPPIEVERP